MRIAFVSASVKQYGGKAYERMAEEALSRHFQVEHARVVPAGVRPLLAKIIYALVALFALSRRKEYDVVVRDLDSCVLLNRRPVKTIAIVHHIDYSFAPALIKFISLFTTSIILRNLRKVDVIVVVSKYWAEWFKKRGYNNIHIIYNAFDIEKFNLEKPALSGKPIIYLGNNQKAKGAAESRLALKGLDAHFVTSDNLSYEEYLKLLASSSLAITMSLFDEGWCRTAHEAMLLKTPVVGSGRGGMRELLEGGKQMICKEFSSLRGKVEYLLKHPEIREKMGEDGYSFVKQFTKERFAADWKKLLGALGVNL